MNDNNLKAPSQIFKEYLDTFFTGDIEKTLNCLTDDVVWKVQGARSIPTIGIRHGKAEVREWLASFPVHFKPIEFDISQSFNQDDQCVIIGRFKHQILSTGKDFSSDFAAICKVRDEKICAYNFLEDSYSLWESFQSSVL